MIVIGEKQPMIADQGAYALALDRATRLFKSAELQEAAKFACTVHERVADYIEQAPVLAIVVRHGGGRLHGGLGGARIYAAHRIGSLAERGARLREVMAAYGLPLPLRKLKAKALSFCDAPALKVLASLPPSVLSQAIPTSIAAQRKLLSSLGEWASSQHSLMHAGRWVALNEWAVVQIAKHGVRRETVSTVVDFITKGDLPLNVKWEWPRAIAAAEDWHDRLSAGDARRKFGVLADQVIDQGAHPELTVIDGYEFAALRTPIAIHSEGCAMRHCVSSYVQSVIDGHCSIISVRRDEQRIATLELMWLTGGTIRQLKGRFNARPAGETVKVAQSYARDLRVRLTSQPEGSASK